MRLDPRYIIRVKDIMVGLLLLALAFAASACGDASGSIGTPGSPHLGITLQESTDSTVAATARVFGQADAWRWSVASKSGETDSDTVSVEVPREDTVATYDFCVRGVNYNSDRSREATGPQVCEAFDVNPSVLDAPSAPDSIQIDTVAVSADSGHIYDFGSGTLDPELALSVGDTSTALAMLTERGDHLYVCARIEGVGNGWYQTASINPVVIANPGAVVLEEEEGCGVEWSVDDTTVAQLVDAPDTLLVPVEGQSETQTTRLARSLVQ